MFRVDVLAEAKKDLAKLDKGVGRRIAKKIQWLVENLAHVEPEPLAGGLAGLFKLRVGDYRVLFEIRTQAEVLLIHAVGHRREIYKRR